MLEARFRVRRGDTIGLLAAIGADCATDPSSDRCGHQLAPCRPAPEPASLTAPTMTP